MNLVLAAAKTLRRDHEPARATVLLDDYFERYPHGALREEAMALAIEAAASQGDKAAARYAAGYLAEFPNGHFRQLAERARARFTR